jgi:cytochrome P450
VVEINATDPEVVANPFGTYARVAAEAAVARLVVPGMTTFWVLTRLNSARGMLTDTRFELNSASFMRPPNIPEHCLKYMRTMSEMNGPEHLRLRRAVAPAFTPKRMDALRPRITEIVDGLIDTFPAGDVDLVEHFARPLPMDVICSLVGIPPADRESWQTWGAAIAAGDVSAFGEAIPGIMAGAEAALAHRRAVPADDLLGYLLTTTDLTDEELVTLVWQLVLAGQTPTNLLTNAVEALLDHPDQDFLADPARAVEELLRWGSPQLLTVPRYATQDVEIDGVRIGRGEPVSAAMVAASRDPHVFPSPEVLDLARDASGHLAFGHGPHFCLGASLARVETEIALTRLLTRFPKTAVREARRAPDGGTWRLGSLRVALDG